MLKPFAFAVLLLLACASPVGAGPFEDGQAAYRRDDYATALKLWRPLAARGDARAQGLLGFMYERGHGVPQDYGQAMAWYRSAAEQGHALSQVALSRIYEDGLGVAQDSRQAASWRRRAAEQGNITSQVKLAFMYEFGNGVPQDYVRAHMWFNLGAASSLDPKVREIAVKGRDAVAAKMTPAQIAEAQRLAREWKPKLERKPKKGN